MKKTFQKMMSIIIATVLMLLPMEGVFASQMKICDDQDKTSIEANLHSDNKSDHHDAQLVDNHDDKCALLMGEDCCCDDNGCVCLTVSSLFVGDTASFIAVDYSLKEITFFNDVSHIKYNSPPLIRPHIA